MTHQGLVRLQTAGAHCWCRFKMEQSFEQRIWSPERKHTQRSAVEGRRRYQDTRSKNEDENANLVRLEATETQLLLLGEYKSKTILRSSREHI